MTLRLVTVSLDPATGVFPEDPLAGLEGEVLSVVEHFFFHGAMPHLLLVCYLREQSVGQRGARPAAGQSRADSRPDPRAELSPEERRLYERLRAWRLARAEAEGLLPYAVLNNREAAEVVRRMPRTLAALKEIRGIGEAKAAKFGRDLLDLLADAAGGGDGA